MLPGQHQSDPRSASTSLQALRITLWAVPLLMAVLGITFTLFEHGRHRGEADWPWPTFMGIIVLGIVGPALSWFSLRWAIRTAEAYFRSQDQLAHRADELATINRLSLASSRSLDPKETVATILEETMTALDANAGMIFIQRENQPGLRLEAHQGISISMAEKEARLQPGHCLCGQAVSERQVLLAQDVGLDPRCTSNLCICEGFRSVACAPLEVKGQLVGLIQLASTAVFHFQDDQRDFLAAAAAQVSVFIENARLYDQVRSFNIELEQKVNRRTSELESARWALAEKARQLQRLLSQSYRVQEDTQARIAHDMHDGVTQMIIGALYETQAAKQSLQDDPDRAAESLQHAQDLLAEVETEIRRVIYDLHPPVLDMMGLVVAMKRFAATYEAAFGIPCHVNVVGRPRRLDKDADIAIYRIIQAALHNVASHAQATEAHVAFDFGSAALQVIVSDNGRGFDIEKIMATPGEKLGLVGMKERAEGLGAQLDVTSTPGIGARIKLTLHSPKYAAEESG
ncbi:MAG: GAF domain-containing protein [Anaerolineae bacterium]